VSNYVPNYEELHYQVHPSQLGWAMHQLNAVPNYNVLGYAPVAGGMCIIVVQVPVGTQQVDWRAPVPPRRRWPRWNLPRLARGVALALCAVALAYIAYSIYVSGVSQTTSSAPVAQAPSLWDQLTGTAPRGEPVVEPAKGVEMPWDAAGRQVGDAVEGATRVLTAGFIAVVLAIVAWVALKARGAWKALRK